MSGAAMAAGGGPHVPVMLTEVLAALAPRDGERIVDGTFGAGGYATAILERAHCEVLGIDRDPTAIAAGSALAERFGGRLRLRHGRFSELEGHADACGWQAVDGIVLDLGVSSMQLDQAERGFSFQHDGPLDMRMGQDGPSAADVVNTYEERALADLIYAYGEERKSRQIARRIVEARKRAPITRTRMLAEIVANALGGAARRQAIHPATRTFQALRIFVNRELHELAQALFAAERILRAGGRLVVVAFHSLEDRIVKRFLADRTRTEAGGSRHRPQQHVEPATFVLIGRGAATPSDSETADNPRARSARLRAGRRTEAPARGADEAMLGLTKFPVTDLPEDNRQ